MKIVNDPTNMPFGDFLKKPKINTSPNNRQNWDCQYHGNENRMQKICLETLKFAQFHFDIRTKVGGAG